MIKKIYSLTLLILLIALPINISASTISSNSINGNTLSSNTNIPTVSNVYKEGWLYHLSQLINKIKNTVLFKKNIRYFYFPLIFHSFTFHYFS